MRFIPGLRRLAQFLTFTAGAVLLSARANAHDTWDNRTSLITGTGNSNVGFAHNGSRFLMVTSSPTTYWKSAAGTSNWTFSTFSFPTTGVTSLSIAHAGGATLVAGGNNVLMRTTVADPVTASWTSQRPVTRPNSTNPALNRVRYLNDRFLIGTNSYNDTTTVTNSYSELITSTDAGLTWTSSKFTYASLTNTTFNLRDVAFKPGTTAGNGTYVFATGTNTVLIAPETLASASRVTFSGSTSDTAAVITYAANVFVVITTNGKIFTSATGATGAWTQRTTPISTASWNDIFHDGTRFVLVGNSVTGSSPARPAILHSTDGLTWTEAATVPSLSQSLSTVFRADGLWLAGGATRTLLTSGSSSVTAPAFSVQPTAFNGSVGGTITLTATVTGSPTPTLQWFRNDSSPTPLVDDARISGSTTATLTITGATFADAKDYYLAATNTVGTTLSSTALVSINASGGGAVLTPYGITNSLGGELLPGTSPAAALIGGSTGRFTVGTGFTALPNNFVNGVAYGFLGGLSQDGSKAVLNPLSNGIDPPLVHDVVAGTSAQMPVPTLPLGPITSYSFFNALGIANNGNIVGQFLGQDGVTRGFHYAAATQTYTLLGNVPNATNDVATNPASITADGTTVAGYERIRFFDGPFIWNTNTGFTLLPPPANGGPPSGDIREISPLGRYVVGYGEVSASGAFGSGSTAMRWDRGSPLGAPVGFALPRRATDTFADALTVNDDGTAGGTVRQTSSFSTNRAAVWLPSGALIVLPDYLQATYGLDLTGFTLTFVSSISNDRRTLTGNALRPDGSVDGWILTLPAPIPEPTPAPEITVRQFVTDRANGATVSIGTRFSGSSGFAQQIFYVRNDGTAPLTGLTAAISGTNAADFTLAYDVGVPAMPSSLEFNTAVTVYVRFAPLAGSAGTRVATLTLTNNDSDESPFTLTLNGTALAPPSLTAFETYLSNAGVPTNLRGINDDPDGDGVSNLMEFALGRLPNTPDATPLPAAVLSGGVLSYTYTRAQPVHVVYSVKTTPTLSTSTPWTATGVDQGTPDVNGLTTASTPMGTDLRRFLRLEVSLTPVP
jgi:Immunoglobulin I-set domain